MDAFDNPLRSVDVPLSAMPLKTRNDIQRAAIRLCGAAEQYRSSGGALVRMPGLNAYFSRRSQEMEGFCRLLWGIAPLVAGGAAYDCDRVREGLAHGADPRHPESWGIPSRIYDQRFVDMAAIGYAMLVAPDELWTPLDRSAQLNIVNLLNTINTAQLRDSNWLLFRVIVNLALWRANEAHNPSLIASDLDRIESFYLGDGWYSDGPFGYCDYYAAFAFQFYLILYSFYGEPHDPVRARLYKQRAREFAAQYAYWFDDDGCSIPYGRSLTYRFGHAAFWAVCALLQPADGTIKGTLLRHLRWWFRNDICSVDGLLTVGYTHQQSNVAERYTSSSSPYWALKAFLPLMLPATHPFWDTQEVAAQPLSSVVVQRQPQMILCRTPVHAFALVGAAHVPHHHRNADSKYAKFCYSSKSGFNIPSDSRFAGPCDSMLVVSDDGEYFRGRVESDVVVLRGTTVISEWKPWPDVNITTWLVPAPPWHVRIHLIRSRRHLITKEGGFSLGLRPTDEGCTTKTTQTSAIAIVDTIASVITNLHGERSATLADEEPHTNIMHERVAIPFLSGRCVGDTWLASAVGLLRVTEADFRFQPAPIVTFGAGSFVVTDAHGSDLYRSDDPNS